MRSKMPALAVFSIVSIAILFGFQNCAKTQFTKEIGAVGKSGTISGNQSQIDFGLVLINTTNAKSFSLTNSTANPITIDQVYLQNNISVFSYTSSCAANAGVIPVPANGQCDFVISFRPTAAQAYTDILNFKISTSAVVSVTLKGSGVTSAPPSTSPPTTFFPPTTTPSTWPPTTLPPPTTTVPPPTTTIATVYPSCGSSVNNQTVTSQPANNLLCNSGSPTSFNFDSVNYRYTWNCAGSSNTNPASCVAYLKANAQCAGTSSPVLTPVSSNCSPGTILGAAVVGSNWQWTCNGINGGTSVLCSAPVHMCYYKPQKHICCFTIAEYNQYYSCLSVESITVRMAACSTQAQLDLYRQNNPGVCP